MNVSSHFPYFSSIFRFSSIFLFFIQYAIFEKNCLITFPLIFIHYTTLIPHFFILDVQIFSKYFIHHQCWLAQLVAPSCFQVGPWILFKQLGPTIWNRGMIGWTKLLGGMVGPWNFPKLANCPRQLGPTIWLCMMEWTNGC